MTLYICHSHTPLSLQSCRKSLDHFTLASRPKSTTLNFRPIQINTPNYHALSSTFVWEHEVLATLYSPNKHRYDGRILSKNLGIEAASLVFPAASNSSASWSRSTTLSLSISTSLRVFISVICAAFHPRDVVFRRALLGAYIVWSAVQNMGINGYNDIYSVVVGASANCQILVRRREIRKTAPRGMWFIKIDCGRLDTYCCGGTELFEWPSGHKKFGFINTARLGEWFVLWWMGGEINAL